MAKAKLPTAQDLCASVPEQVRPFVAELAENVIFMHDKLIETRKGLVKQTLVIPYDNGGGQTGIRENPAFKAYQTMLASYRKALEELSSTLRRYGGLEKKNDEENPLAKILAEAEKVLVDAS